MQTRSGGGGEDDGTFRRLQRTLLDRTRARTWWGAGGCGEPRVSSPRPHLLFIALRDEAHQPKERLDVSDQGTGQGTGQGPINRWIKLVEIILAFSSILLAAAGVYYIFRLSSRLLCTYM